MKQHGYRSAERRRFQHGQLYVQQPAANDLVFENFGFKIRGAKISASSHLAKSTMIFAFIDANILDDADILFHTQSTHTEFHVSGGR